MVIYVAMVLVAAINLADLCMSVWLLQRKHMIEANPLAGFIWKKMGALGLILWKVVLITIYSIIVLFLIVNDQELAVGLILGVGIGSGLVAVYQLYSIFSLYRKVP